MRRAAPNRVKAPWIDVIDGRKVLHPAPHIITTQALTPQTFAEFGSVVEDPAYPHNPPRRSTYQPPVAANQGTARKYTNVSQLTNLYNEATSGQPANLQMTYFACEPRKLDIVVPRQDLFYSQERTPDAAVPHGLFKIEVMERHPFTTQTFAPLGLADTITPAQTRGWPREQDLGTGYVVIVAPNTKTASGEDVPDTKNIKAFLANGRQAVTYGANVWHSPMAVVGKEVVGFLVTQWANGVADEDCQEVYFEPQQLVKGDCVGVIVKGFEGHHGREERL